MKRKSGVLEYAHIMRDFMENGKKNNKLIKHLGRINSPVIWAGKGRYFKWKRRGMR